MHRLQGSHYLQLSVLQHLVPTMCLAVQYSTNTCLVLKHPPLPQLLSQPLSQPLQHPAQCIITAPPPLAPLQPLLAPSAPPLPPSPPALQPPSQLPAETRLSPSPVLALPVSSALLLTFCKRFTSFRLPDSHERTISSLRYSVIHDMEESAWMWLVGKTDCHWDY